MLQSAAEEVAGQDRDLKKGGKHRSSAAGALAAATLILGAGVARAATIAELNMSPTVVQTRPSLLGRPVKVAVNSAGQLYVMTQRGWIYSLSGTFADLASVKMPGATTSPAVALAATVTGSVYAARSDGTVVRYNSALTALATATVTGQVVDLDVDGAGNVYVANSLGQIIKLNGNLTQTLTQGTVTGVPVAMSVEMPTGSLYVATSTSLVHRLNTSLATLASGTVAGTPVGIASDSTGVVVVATSSGLSKISPAIVTLATASLTGLVGVKVNSAGSVVALGSGGTVTVLNTSLMAPRSVATAVAPGRGLAVSTTGPIYITGGPDGASEGDPHLTTIDGVRYDFQSAGEFVLLRHTAATEGPVCAEGVGAVEIQVRQFPVATTASTCVSLNGAVAALVGKRRVTYQPNLSGQPDPSGLQLRIDGKLIVLDAGGMDLGEGGRIVPTSAPGGLEIDFPDDTVLFISPGWWASQGKWYLNVNVVPGRRACGIAGTVPAGSWLPALPDGKSMGPAPQAAHERHVELYVRFADAWRVTAKTSLFDYAPGTSTETFTTRGWPPETGGCDIPGAVRAEGASQEVAQRACREVLGDPANCIFDVMVTGHAELAKTYLTSRQVQPAPERAPPEPRHWLWAILAIALVLAVALIVGVLMWVRRRSPT